MNLGPRLLLSATNQITHADLGEALDEKLSSSILMQPWPGPFLQMLAPSILNPADPDAPLLLWSLA